MARPLRIQFPGAFYHVTSRGNERKAIFRNDQDRQKFLSYLESARERYGAKIYIYCLMENHYHLLLETPRGNLAQILHHLNGAYTTYHNLKRRRSGHLFQGRYRALLVEMETYCQELSRYIHLNPVRAELVKAPEDYRWSSYPAYIGLKRKPFWLETSLILSYFSPDESVAQRKYREFVEEVVEISNRNPLEEVFASTFLGSENFIDRIWKRKRGLTGQDSRNIPALKFLAEKPSLSAIKEAVERTFGSSGRLSKKFGLYISRQKGGYALKEIGRFYGMKEAAVSQAVGRFRGAILRTPSLNKKLQQILEQLKLSYVET
jgi:putative transposase